MDPLKEVKRSLRCRLTTHWFALRLWVAGFIVLLIAYTLWIKPNTFSDMLENQELRVGYLKFPDNGYVYDNKPYGYELKIIEKFAKKNKLNLKYQQMDLDSMSKALNINKIDIGIGGLTDNLINQEFNKSTDSWDDQTFCIIEQRIQGKKSTFSSIGKKDLIHVGQRFGDPKTMQLLEEKLEVASFVSNLEDERTLVKKLENKEIKYMVTTLGRLRTIQAIYPNIRRAKTLKGSKESLKWMLPRFPDKAFVYSLNNFISAKDTQVFKRELSNELFKKPKHFHFLDSLKIQEHIQTRLPKYEQWFKLAANEYDLEWTLLAALAYQESRWSVEAVSPTKVRGIMQITTDTAKSLGIDNRLDAFSTIFAGAKYLSDLRSRIPKRVVEPDRTRMALGSYNIGFGYILAAYKDARKGNFTTITWKDIEKRLPTIHKISQYDQVDNSSPTFARGYQAIKYVARIQEFDHILRHYASD